MSVYKYLLKHLESAVTLPTFEDANLCIGMVYMAHYLNAITAEEHAELAAACQEIIHAANELDEEHENLILAHLKQAAAAAKSKEDFRYVCGLLDMALMLESITPEENTELREIALLKIKAE